MRYMTVCSGIEAPSAAWEPLGWEPVAFSEVDKFCNAVLAHRYQMIPNLGDMNEITQEQIASLGPIDVFCGGTPCQGFSVAGRRGGLDDPRSRLAIRFVELASLIRPRWIVWENVPGVLSSGGGEDFRRFVAALADIGYLGAWRVLDAQYFGLAQRRKRVFFVGYLGDWRPSTAVLLERNGMSWNPPPRRGQRKDVAGTISSRDQGGGGLGTDFESDGGVVPTLDANYGRLQGCSGQDANHGHGHLVAHALRAEGFDGSEDGSGRGTPIVPMELWKQTCNCGHQFTASLDTRCPGCGEFRDGYTHGNPIAFDCKQSGEGGEVAPPLRALNHDKSHANAGGQLAVAIDYTNGLESDITGTLESAQSKGNRGHGTLTKHGVRRLTPKECARLQGFPDEYLDIEYRGKPAADGPKYKALGNSIAVPVLSWIGKRIMQVERVMGR